jgi:hypothetical protein
MHPLMPAWRRWRTVLNAVITGALLAAGAVGMVFLIEWAAYLGLVWVWF